MRKITKKVPTQTQYRDSKDGQWTTKREADRAPSTHEKERIKHPERK